MLIYNQDLDQQNEYNPSIDTLQLAAVYHDTTYMGTNLILNDVLLGTFDSHQEAVEERDIIRNYQHEIYAVSGRSPMWEDWSVICNENIK